MIKKAGLLFIILLYVSNIYSQNASDILMRVNGSPITVEEFRYIYEKNNGKDANYSYQSLNDYIELYSKFKLKVAKAKDLKLDTIQSLQEELAGYKRQLANSYLTDKEIMKSLMDELSERQKQDVRFQHILVSFGDNRSDSMMNVALQKIKSIEREIKNGKTFEAAAKEFSDDKLTREKGGDIGFFTAMMPEGFYDLENAIYTLPIGKVSGPIKTKLGYHLIKVVEKRPARGIISVAHILVKSTNRSDDARKTIEEALSKLKAGEDFASVASKYSEDVQTSKSGGYLPAFGINTYDSKFEDAAFELKNDGDISDIIQTRSGYHIIKRIKKTDVSNDNATLRKQNEAKVKKDERFNISKKRLIEDIKKASGFKINKDVLNKFIGSLSDDFLSFKWSPEWSATVMKEPLLNFGGDVNFSVYDFAQFAKKNTKTRLKFEKSTEAIKQVVNNLVDEFIDEKAIDYEQKVLEIKYPEFKALLREYEEGILLFEATKRNVWDRANQDTVGLTQFFQLNSKNYKTDEKGNLLLYNIATTDLKKANKIRKYASKKTPEEVLKKFNKKNEQVVSYIEETLEKINPRFANLKWEINSQSELTKNTEVGGYTFSMISRIFPVRPKTLKEARGYVVADYQEHLEKEWISSLEKEYTVEVNNDVLNKLVKKF